MDSGRDYCARVAGSHKHTSTHAHGHGHSHGRGADEDAETPVGRTALIVLLGLLALTAVAVVVGAVALWPDRHAVAELRREAPYLAAGVHQYDARVDQVQRPCARPGEVTDSCGNVLATLESGPDEGASRFVPLPPGVASSGLAKGDRIQVLSTPSTGDAPGTPTAYTFGDVDRSVPLLWLGIGFVVAVVAVARLRGLLALVSVGFGAVVFGWFVLPSLLSGHSGVAVALVGSSAIMFVVLYLTHGPSARTSAALAGTLLGILVTAGAGWLAVRGSALSGYSDDTSDMLSSFASAVSLQGVLVCAVVIAGLGVVNDITITQASAVWELRAAGPDLSRLQLFARGMRIGRDHIASTVYTIVFAYAGTGLVLLLLVYLYDRPLLDTIPSELFAEEIVRVLAGGIGLVLAVPITTAIASLVVAGPAAGFGEGGEAR